MPDLESERDVVPHGHVPEGRVVLEAEADAAIASRHASDVGAIDEDRSCVRDLEAGGWIRASGQAQGATGRSATTYELQEDGAFVLGVDLGGTKIHVALANLIGAIVAEAVEETDRRGGTHVVEQIDKMMKRVAAGAGVDIAMIRRGAMGSPGVCQPSTGRITIAPNILGLDEIDVTQALRRHLGFDMAIENDVNLAAKGEHWQGCCRNAENFAFVALGTGILGYFLVPILRSWRLFF